MSSGIDPYGAAITGVPVASASMTDRPNGSGKCDQVHERERAAQELVALGRTDRAEVVDAVPAQVGLDLVTKVGLVLHDAGDAQRKAGPMSQLDRLVRSLVRVDAAEEQQVVAVAQRRNVNAAGSRPWWMVASYRSRGLRSASLIET